MEFLVIDGRPCPEMVAPYVYLVLRRARQTATAIYRGDDPAARPIIHAHGGHTQRELANATPAQRLAWGVEGTPNRPGFSEHELKSDGEANPHVPAGHDLEPWQVGIDSGSDSEHDKRAIVEAARHYGWRVRHPYSAGIEGHHWCFATQPKPRSLAQRALIIAVRHRLPKR